MGNASSALLHADITVNYKSTVLAKRLSRDPNAALVIPDGRDVRNTMAHNYVLLS